LIHFKDISKTFASKEGAIKAIDHLSLSIHQNEIFGIIGESGAGKSTLLRFINALETPDEGMVEVNGVDVQSLNKKELRQFKKKIGMIFQQFNLLGNKTVEENILLPLEIHDYTDALDIQRVLEFVGLTDHKDRYPSELSGGQKQRVGIARGLITRPNILLCDEPTSALDENTKREITNLLARASTEFDVTILIVTHELDVVKRLCERVAILEHGKLVEVVDVQNGESKESLNVSYSELAREVLVNGQ
jgi:D-methionine transport system ATP-binding protein